jgi:hypothetical protein
MEANKEIKYLTGIRGVAVLLVLFAHLLPAYSFNKTIAYLGMSLFFTLSGIVFYLFEILFAFRSHHTRWLVVISTYFASCATLMHARTAPTITHNSARLKASDITWYR